MTTAWISSRARPVRARTTGPAAEFATRAMANFLKKTILFIPLFSFSLSSNDLSCETNFSLKLDFPPNEILFSVDEAPLFLVSLSRQALETHSKAKCEPPILTCRIASQLSQIDFLIDKTLHSNTTIEGEDVDRTYLEITLTALPKGDYLFQAFTFEASKTYSERAFQVSSNSAQQFAEIFFSISEHIASSDNVRAVASESDFASQTVLPAASSTLPAGGGGGGGEGDGRPAIYIDFPPHGFGLTLLYSEYTHTHTHTAPPPSSQPFAAARAVAEPRRMQGKGQAYT